MNTSGTSAPGVMNSLPNTFSPSMGIVIVVVIAVLFFLAFFSIYVRRCARGPGSAGQLEAAANQAAGNRPLRNNSSSSRTAKGLDKSVVESLPVVHFKDLKNLEMEKKACRLQARGQHDGEDVDDNDDDDDDGQHRECAVCLSDFEEDDDLRLLPGCKHVFHQDCIDVWFQSHSTCPLCRDSLVPTAAGKHVHDAADGHHAHDSTSVVIEEQESETGDLGALGAPHQVIVAIHGDDEEESARQAAAVRSYEGTTMNVPVGPSISRDDQRDSARLALYRNSRSFKKAARGVVAHERASSVSSRGGLETGMSSSKSWKLAAPPTPIFEPMRRSFSLDNSDALKYLKDLSSNNQNQVPKLQSQHSLPSTMKLATINLPSTPTTTTTAIIPSSPSNRASRRATGSYSGIEFLRTGSNNSMEKPQVMRSNSEHWVSIELDARRPESFAAAAASSSSKTKPIADKDPRIMRKGADQSSGRDSDRWNFLNLRNLLSYRRSSSFEHLSDTATTEPQLPPSSST